MWLSEKILTLKGAHILIFSVELWLNSCHCSPFSILWICILEGHWCQIAPIYVTVQTHLKLPSLWLSLWSALKEVITDTDNVEHYLFYKLQVFNFWHKNMCKHSYWVILSNADSKLQHFFPRKHEMLVTYLFYSWKVLMYLF